MVSNLPLYDTLYRETTDNDLTNAEKASLVKNIKKMDKIGHELIYVMIKIHEANNGKTYDIKQTKGDIKIDLDNLANKLKQIIWKFSTVHLKKMEEEIRLSIERAGWLFTVINHGLNCRLLYIVSIYGDIVLSEKGKERKFCNRYEQERD